MRGDVLLQADLPHFVEQIAQWGAGIFELAGIAVILLGAIAAGFHAVRHAAKEHGFRGTFETFRRSLGHSILLGLEFLVAADIIGTVLIDPTFRNLGVLAVLVLIRTFLSFALTVEVEGKWPWQKKEIHSDS